jgi:hypothetical protein
MGSSLRRRVVFENALSVPVELSVAEKSCGCLGASIDPSRVGPGERATLEMSVVVTPGAAQVQSVTFKARWTAENGTTAEEAGLCLLRYTPEVRYVVRPEQTAAAVVRGGRASFDVFIRELDSPDEPPALEPMTPERAGWTLTRVEDPSLPRGVLRFRAEGPVGDEPYADFSVGWREAGGAGAAAVLPIRLRSLPPWRCSPGGVVIHGARAASAHRLTLTPRIEGAEPAAVRVRGNEASITATLDGRVVTVRFEPGDATPAIGSTWIDVLDGNGRVLVDIPVAWFLDAPP